MKAILEALQVFWAQFGIPAYPAGGVPDEAVLPYISYDTANVAAMGAAFLTTYDYHSKKAMGHSERLALAEKIAEAIPEQGVRIPLANGGFLALYRNSDFQTLYQDPEDLDVIGVRTSVEVHFYSM